MSEIERADLDQKINEEYRAFERDFRSAAEHAIRCGEMLEEKKSGLNHGEWGPWLRDHFEGSERHAQRFMKVAREQSELDPTRVSDLSLRGALKEISPLKEEPEGEPERPSLKELTEKANAALKKADEGREQARTAYQEAEPHIERMEQGLKGLEQALKDSYGKVSEQEYRWLSDKYRQNSEELARIKERREHNRELLDILDRMQDGEEVSDGDITQLISFSLSTTE